MKRCADLPKRHVDLSEWLLGISGRSGKDLRAIVFRSRKERYKAIRIFSNDPEMMQVPHETTCALGGIAWVVSMAAVPLMRAKGLKFREVEIRTISDLTQKEYREMERRTERLIEAKKRHFGLL